MDALAARIAGEIAMSPDPGATMRKWRETFGLSQSEVATWLEVGASVVSDYESGRRRSPGVGTVRRVVESFLALDKASGGHVVARFVPTDSSPAAGVLDLGEYHRSIPAMRLVEAIEGQVLVAANLEERSVQGYTLIDSIRAIAGLDATDYVRLYGASTQRALCFTAVKYGRSPMIAVRVHPMKPSLVVYHRPEDVDKLAFRLADVENIPLVVTQLELEDLKHRLRSLGG